MANLRVASSLVAYSQWIRTGTLAYSGVTLQFATLGSFRIALDNVYATLTQSPLRLSVTYVRGADLAVRSQPSQRSDID